ncbi:MAG: ABC transporter ATP-binding protein [Mariniphaga sp.]|nr:ABC transporter ATP-binding protein [Mariniphaga sp.]MDD4224912.1 ABC transporter ATP-binding protein [Mariniphaga sp.]
MKKIIRVKNLVKKFGSFVANDHLNFDVFQGEIFGFLGANGAGKTTTMRILCGLSAPTSGEVNVAGFDIVRETEKVKRKMGYMSQKFSLYEDLTVRENIQLYAGIYGISSKTRKEKMNTLLKKLELENAQNKLISALPLGWKQKLAFSVAILHDPAIVFLDEPTGGVDPVTRRKFWDLIFEASHNGITVFVTTHYMDEAEYCDRVSIMDAGKIEELGSPVELKEKYHAQNMDEVFIHIAR